MSSLKPLNKDALLFWSVLFRSDLFTEKTILERINSNFLADNSYFIYRDHFIPQREYYAKEMGEAELLKKFFIVSLALVNRDFLHTSKRAAIDLESQLAKIGRRTANFDPGIITLENVVLSSGKNYGHRLYVSEGIFYELELIYQNKTFTPLPWSYPDYKSSEAIDFFNSQRSFLATKLVN